MAARIGEVLTRQGRAVDVLPVGAVEDLEPYTNVVLGSAIRMGKLLPEALAFLEANQAALEDKNFSVFIVCLTLVKPDEESLRIVKAYLDPVRALVEPLHEGMFAGVMDLSKLSWGDRLLIRFFKIQPGDFRDWEAIETWAEGLV